MNLFGIFRMYLEINHVRILAVSRATIYGMNYDPWSFILNRKVIATIKNVSGMDQNLSNELR